MKISDEQLLNNIFEAYYEARKNKRNTVNQLRFEVDMESNILDLFYEIKNRNYKIGNSICFIVSVPVKREIFAADFRDRIVHHLLFKYISPIFEPRLIYDSYSCRKTKGTLFALKRLEHNMRSVTDNYKKDAYILKMDLKGYFMSIDKKILFNIVSKELEKVKNKFTNSLKNQKWNQAIDYDMIIYLLEIVIFHDCTSQCVVKGDIKNWKGLPKSKSLFYSKDGKGLPIGNLTSQLFSNIYLNGFDNYVKRVLKIKHYGRYVDDFYVFCNDVKQVNVIKQKIDIYLKDNLGLTTHPNKLYIQHFHRGVSFVGGVVRPYRRYVKSKTLANFSNTLREFNDEHIKNINFLPSRKHLFKLRASINSYTGFVKHFKSQSRMQRIIAKWNIINKYGSFYNGHHYKLNVKYFPPFYVGEN